MANLIFDHRSQVVDRRRWEAVSEFPIVDCDGITVHEDRRKNAERRGYQLEEISTEDVNIKNILQ